MQMDAEFDRIVDRISLIILVTCLDCGAVTALCHDCHCFCSQLRRCKYDLSRHWFSDLEFVISGVVVNRAHCKRCNRSHCNDCSPFNSCNHCNYCNHSDNARQCNAIQWNTTQYNALEVRTMQWKAIHPASWQSTQRE